MDSTATPIGNVFHSKNAWKKLEFHQMVRSVTLSNLTIPFQSLAREIMKPRNALHLAKLATFCLPNELATSMSYAQTFVLRENATANLDFIETLKEFASLQMNASLHLYHHALLMRALTVVETVNLAQMESRFHTT